MSCLRETANSGGPGFLKSGLRFSYKKTEGVPEDTRDTLQKGSAGEIRSHPKTREGIGSLVRALPAENQRVLYTIKSPAQQDVP